MNTHVISGCGPGPGHPPDTPQWGVRSVRRFDAAEAALDVLLGVYKLSELMECQLMLTPRDYREVREIAQWIADKAARLMGDGAKESIDSEKPLG